VTVLPTVEVRTCDLPSESFPHTMPLWCSAKCTAPKCPLCATGHSHQSNSGLLTHGAAEWCTHFKSLDERSTKQPSNMLPFIAFPVATTSIFHFLQFMNFIVKRSNVTEMKELAFCQNICCHFFSFPIASQTHFACCDSEI